MNFKNEDVRFIYLFSLLRPDLACMKHLKEIHFRCETLGTKREKRRLRVKNGVLVSGKK